LPSRSPAEARHRRGDWRAAGAAHLPVRARSEMRPSRSRGRSL
jgi:hypothetical protein